MTIVQKPVLAGNSLAGCLALDMLLEAYPARDILVIAPPRGSTAEWHVSLADHARGMGVTVLTPESVNDDAVLEALKSHQADLLLSVYYTQIFRPALLESVSGPAVNVHPALLPAHRGTAPLIWSIVAGDETTGVTIHELTPGIDEGSMLYQSPLPVHPNDTGYTLHLKAARLARALVADLVRRVAAGIPLPEPMEQVGDVSYHSKKDPRVNHIDWTQPRERIRNVVRALASPLPGAYSQLDGERLTIERISVHETASPTGTPGLLDLSGLDDNAVVWASDGPMKIELALFAGESLTGSQLAQKLAAATGKVLR